MRKSKIVVALGGFVVMTALLCIGSSDKIYKNKYILILQMKY